MTEDQNETDSDNTYIESLNAARDDALFSFNEHIRVFEEEAAKGGRIAQLDGLILTIFASIYAAGNIELSLADNCLVIVGFVLLLLGFILGMLGQFSMNVAVGVSEKGLDGILQQKSSEIEYKEWSIEHYSKWISQANIKSANRARIVKSSAVVSVLGLLLLLVGILISLPS